jgi:hypothetical protein
MGNIELKPWRITMTQAKTNLRDLSNRSLRNRISSAEDRLWLMREEEARREKINAYGTDTPRGLIEYECSVTFEFALTVRAKNEIDAKRIVDEDGWLEWYSTSPANNVTVDDFSTSGEIYTDESTAESTLRGIPAGAVIH